MNKINEYLISNKSDDKRKYATRRSSKNSSLFKFKVMSFGSGEKFSSLEVSG